MKLEGTQTEPDIEKGNIVISIEKTTIKEMVRLQETIALLFDQGVMNIRNGKAVLHFDDRGKCRAIDKDVSSWRDGKEVITRVAMFDKAIVAIDGKVV